MLKEIRAVKEYQHRLSQAEKLEIGQELSVATLHLCGVEAEKKAANKNFKDRMDALREVIEEKSRALKDGFVWREEICIGLPGNDGLVSFLAPTGEVVEVRVMTDSERQQWLFDDDADQVNDEGGQAEEEPTGSLWAADPADGGEGATH